MVSNLSEGEQIAVAQRLGMIQYLPVSNFTPFIDNSCFFLNGGAKRI